MVLGPRVAFLSLAQGRFSMSISGRGEFNLPNLVASTIAVEMPWRTKFLSLVSTSMSAASDFASSVALIRHVPRDSREHLPINMSRWRKGLL